MVKSHYPTSLETSKLQQRCRFEKQARPRRVGISPGPWRVGLCKSRSLPQLSSILEPLEPPTLGILGTGSHPGLRNRLYGWVVHASWSGSDAESSPGVTRIRWRRHTHPLSRQIPHPRPRSVFSITGGWSGLPRRLPGGVSEGRGSGLRVSHGPLRHSSWEYATCPRGGFPKHESNPSTGSQGGWRGLRRRVPCLVASGEWSGLHGSHEPRRYPSAKDGVCGLELLRGG